MNLFLQFLENHDRKRIIMDRDSAEPYLERFYLFLKDRKNFPFNIFLHKFLRSDPDDLHDHPWPYFTLILKGGYWEWIPLFVEGEIGGVKVKTIAGEQKVWRGRGHFRICKANSYHRIELEPGITPWTMFMPGPQQREWGFLTHKNWISGTFKWIKHDNYIANRTNSMNG